MDVVTGEDAFRSKLGAWDWVGARALSEPVFVPDFSARVTSRCKVLQVSRHLYAKAVSAYGDRTQAGTMPDAALPLYTFSSDVHIVAGEA